MTKKENQLKILSFKIFFSFLANTKHFLYTTIYVWKNKLTKKIYISLAEGVKYICLEISGTKKKIETEKHWYCHVKQHVWTLFFLNQNLCDNFWFWSKIMWGFSKITVVVRKKKKKKNYKHKNYSTQNLYVILEGVI